MGRKQANEKLKVLVEGVGATISAVPDSYDVGCIKIKPVLEGELDLLSLKFTNKDMLRPQKSPNYLHRFKRLGELKSKAQDAATSIEVDTGCEYGLK
jgi:hypothetical protein